MSMAVAILTLLTRLPYGIALFRTCVPNTQIILNGRVCICDNTGHWNQHNCRSVERRQNCQPGQIIWEDCTQCICQENGKLLCTTNACAEESTTPINRREFGAGALCTPFRSYYVNCNLCVCPASGRTSEARCAKDSSCSIKRPPSPSDFLLKKNVCVPNVMYLFPCIHCLCTDEGKFVTSKCVETCHKRKNINVIKCNPMTFFRKECNVCRCPANGQLNDELCTSAICNTMSKFNSLIFLKNQTSICSPHHFIEPRCIYCDCNADGSVNNNACLALDCIKTSDFKYDSAKSSCRSGEMVPICRECFCPRNGQTNPTYCTEACSFHYKLSILNTIIKTNSVNRLIDRETVNNMAVGNRCEPNSIYLNGGKFCICPDNGSTDYNLCSSATETTSTLIKYETIKREAINFDFNISCVPNTFVEFDCNTCYCTKQAKIDPKWCTYDDCEAKRAILANHKITNIPKPIPEVSDICTPGSISKVECNFCICPENGLLKDRACTKNHCKSVKTVQNMKFICEPLAYYQVDCNTCFCPSDGLKNVAKCTKNQCEKNFLRSDICVPGELFSDDCNVCVCPPNGDKSDKACTNHTCSDKDTPWQKIFQLSQNLLGSPVVEDTTRNLDLCFPGEEFVVGCKLCVCPDMGLREYAPCTPILCDENNQTVQHQETQNEPEASKPGLVRTRRYTDEHCETSVFNESSGVPCTPGSMYIIRCQQCICPYMGNINYFCRPLPSNFYCEKPYPNSNYLPYTSVARRIGDEDNTKNVTEIESNKEKPTHTHTAYKCSTPGKVIDRCYICDCLDDLVIIEEHCFKSSAVNCSDITPSFLNISNKVFLN